MSEPAAIVQPKPASAWEDFIDIFYAPAAVYARRRDGRYGLALLVYVAFTTVIFMVSRPLMQPMFDRIADKQVQAMREGNPNLTDAQVQQAKAIQDRFSQGPIGAVVAVVTQAIWVFGVALLVWIVGKLFGSVASYGQSAMITTYAFFPRILGSLVGAALLFVTDPSNLTNMQSMSFSPARFLGEDASPVMLALLGRFDLFTIWTTVLLGVGLAVVGKLSRTWAMTSAVLIWAVATVGSIVTALRSA